MCQKDAWYDCVITLLAQDKMCVAWGLLVYSSFEINILISYAICGRTEKKFGATVILVFSF
ncbi:hypothetical protein QTP88_009378 [Uroleucon formosanum]